MTTTTDLVARLRAIPVWLVGEHGMKPGWQENGIAAYEAATAIETLAAERDAALARVAVLEDVVQDGLEIAGAYSLAFFKHHARKTLGITHKVTETAHTNHAAYGRGDVFLDVDPDKDASHDAP